MHFFNKINKLIRINLKVYYTLRVYPFARLNLQIPFKSYIKLFYRIYKGLKDKIREV
jgi:hypothetical protein